MPRNPQDIIKSVFRNNRLNLSARDRVLEQINLLDGQGLVEVAKDLGRDQSPDTMGFFLFPLIVDRLSTDMAAYRQMLEALVERDTKDNFRLIALNFLDKIARIHRGQRLHAYVEILQSIVTKGNLSLKFRARAVKKLARHNNNVTFQALLKVIEMEKPQLVDAVANVIIGWTRKRVRFPSEILRSLIKFTRDNPTKALTCPRLLRLLAMKRNSEVINVMNDLRQLVSSNEDRDRLFLAVAPYIKAGALGEFIDSIAAKPSEKGLRAVRTLCVRSPKRAMELYRAKKYDAFIFSLRLAPYLANNPEILGAVRNLLNKRSDTEVSKKAIKAFREVTLQTVPSYAEFGWKFGKELNSSTQTSNPSVTHQGYSTGLQVADAIYKSLGGGSSGSSGTDIFGNHWHAGIFTGFRQLFSGYFSLRGVHVSSLTSAVNEFGSSRIWFLPNVDLVAEMHSLFDDFVREFGCTDDQPFHGARTAPGVNYWTRRQIVDLAGAMVDEDIDYTFADQLDYCWFSWDGTIEDIDELRCDGLVEYTYEKNGVRVCGGYDSNKWNVSRAGTEYPENHNDFHGNGCTPTDYSRGELCPRIQAGSVGNDTSFVQPAPQKPLIHDYDISNWSPCCKYIFFQVDAPLSRHIYVRVKVRKVSEDNFYFVRSEDVFGIGEAEGGAPEGIWSLKRMDTSKWWGGIGFFWLGKTVSRAPVVFEMFGISVEFIAEQEGPDFHGQNGEYEFLLQCIDEGGNVSDEQSFILNVKWDG